MAIGYQAMSALSTTDGSDKNIAIGNYAMDGVSTLAATNNVLIGYGSGGGGWTGTTSIQNVALGNNTLGGAMNAANNNVAVGYNSGSAITTGDSNTLIGKSAGAALTTGGTNIAIGLDAMIVHVTGSNNIAIGNNAMADTNAGSTSYASDNNVFIGTTSGGGTWLNGDSASNVCVGGNTMAGALNASSSNTCIGYSAGNAITEGDNNSCFGSLAGDSILTGSNNVCIGYGTDIGSNKADGNCIAIGVGITADANEFVMGKAGNTMTSAFSSNNTWTQSSDERKKRNIQTIDLGLDFVNDLRTVTFQWKPAEEHPEDWEHFYYKKDKDGNNVGDKIYAEMDTDLVMHGMIAQEVKAALDSAGVDGENFGGWSENKKGQQQLATSMFVYPLIKAVQELSAKVTALENA